MSMIQYKALYRKYRPKTFEQVKGQEHIVRTLENIIKSQKISHGYLFSGPRGTGKTSVAKIFANTINCQEKQDILKPCPKCISNIENAMDIIEMDAASNNGVDEIRDLKEKAQNLPFNSKYKIYIIDEVHMLSKNAFNAFLKILEEPPKHVIFILATTDPQKLPLTILSRLQRFNFTKIQNEIIESQIISVLQEENITFDPEAIKIIAKLSNGGLRDALSMTDQISIYGNGKVEQQALFDIFGIISIDNLLELIKLANNRKLSEVLLFAKKLVSMGADINLMAQNLMTLLKDYIVYKKTHQQELLEYATISNLIEINIPLLKVYQYLEIVMDLIRELAYSQIPNQVLELSLIKLATNDQELIDNNRFDELEQTIIAETATQSTNDMILNQIQEAANPAKPNENVITELNFEDVIFETPTPSKMQSDDDIFDHLFAAKPEPDSTSESQPVVQPEVPEPQPILEPIIEPEPDPNEPIQLDHIEIPYSNLEDLLPKYKFEKPIRETDPQKILDIKNLSNHNMLESVKHNKELQAQIDLEREKQMLELIEQDKQKTFEQQQLSEKILNNENIEEGILSSDKEAFNTRELSFTQYMTEEINAANLRGELIEKDIHTLPQLINLFAIAKREIQDVNKQKWLRLESYQASEKYYEYIAYLMNSKLITSGKDFILVASEDDKIIWKINSFIKQDNFKELIAKVISHPVHVIAISKTLFKETKQAWSELETKPEGVQLQPMVLKSKQQITEEYAKELLGK